MWNYKRTPIFLLCEVWSILNTKLIDYEFIFRNRELCKMYRHQNPPFSRFHLENRRYARCRKDDGRRAIRRYGRTLNIYPDFKIQGAAWTLQQNPEV